MANKVTKKSRSNNIPPKLCRKMKVYKKEYIQNWARLNFTNTTYTRAKKQHIEQPIQG